MPQMSACSPSPLAPLLPTRNPPPRVGVVPDHTEHHQEDDRRWAVCVYCASGPRHPELLAVATGVGFAIADRGWTLVSGGGHVSAMGAVASAARAHDGRTVGVIPKALVHREL